VPLSVLGNAACIIADEFQTDISTSDLRVMVCILYA
jgi:hypothetical protein